MSLEISLANAIVQRQWSNGREVSATGKPQGRSLSRLITRPLNVFFNSPFVAVSVCTETPSRWGYTCYLVALSHLGLLPLFRKPQLCPSIAGEPGEPVNENWPPTGLRFLFFDVQEAWKTSGVYTFIKRTTKTRTTVIGHWRVFSEYEMEWVERIHSSPNPRATDLNPVQSSWWPRSWIQSAVQSGQNRVGIYQIPCKIHM